MPFFAPRSRRRSEKGQSLVEMAIGTVLVMVLLAGTLDLGRLYFTYLSMQSAAAEGAAYGSVEPLDFSGIEARVRGESPAGLISWSSATVTPAILGAACSGGGIRVDVELDFTILTPFLGTVVGRQTVPLRASVVDTILTPTCP
jgi:Flp pilus assembly protein TadG